MEELKSCFDFVEMEYDKVIKYSRIRWLSLFQAVERLLSSWPAIKIYFNQLGKENCHKVVSDFIREQKHEAKCNQTISNSELYLYFVHHYMNLMTKSLLSIESNSLTCIELDEIMRSLKSKLETRIKDKFFGSTVNSALKCICTTNKDMFINEALQVLQKTLNYLEK